MDACVRELVSRPLLVALVAPWSPPPGRPGRPLLVALVALIGLADKQLAGPDDMHLGTSVLSPK